MGYPKTGDTRRTNKDTVLREYIRNTSTRRGSTAERNKRVSNTSDPLNRMGIYTQQLRQGIHKARTTRGWTGEAGHHPNLFNVIVLDFE